MTPRRISCWLGLFLSLGILPLTEVRAEGKKLALLIGVDKYEEGSGFRSLPYTERDVEALAEILLASGYRPEDVRVLTLKRGNENPRFLPTGRNARRELGLLTANRKPEDSLLIALSGHGVRRNVKVGEQTESAAFFCPIDADVTEIETLVSLQSFYNTLRDCKAGEKMMLVDACQNDPTEGRAGAIPFSPAPPPASVAALFSCSEGEVAWDAADLGGGHGVFFHYVIEGLKGAADADHNQKITLAEMTAYTQDKVPDYVSFKKGKRQMPSLLWSGGRITMLDRSGAARVAAGEPVRKSDMATKNGTPNVSKKAGREKTSAAEGTLAGQENDDNALKLKVCWCPPDTFTMGSPATEPDRDDDEDQVRVTLGRGFWMGKYEVTQEQWRTVMGTTLEDQRVQAKESGSYGEGPNYPMYFVSYIEATEFCRKLTASEHAAGRLPAGWEYRLPSEAEWEYACRAGTTTATAFGDQLGGTDANVDGKYPYNGATKGPYLRRTTPVGQYPPNRWGLFDMHGNVREWCLDWHDKALPGGVDPRGPSSGSRRVFRGGSWMSYPHIARSASREASLPTERNEFMGFRVARAPSGS
jgi:formylglycine-generating enzyme required for sulfatase activity